MVINLSDITFENDIFTIDLNDGGLLVLNNIDEALLPENAEYETNIKVINIEVIDREGNIKPCSNVIGLESNNIYIGTKYTEYNGSALNKDNLRYAFIEVKEDE